MKQYRQYSIGAEEPLTRSDFVLIDHLTLIGAAFWTVVIFIVRP
jgi:hypothetical protein